MLGPEEIQTGSGEKQKPDIQSDHWQRERTGLLSTSGPLTLFALAGWKGNPYNALPSQLAKFARFHIHGISHSLR